MTGHAAYDTITKKRGLSMNGNEFDKWDRRFMQLAETVGSWSSCWQENRHVGAVIVKD